MTNVVSIPKEYASAAEAALDRLKATIAKYRIGDLIPRVSLYASPIGDGMALYYQFAEMQPPLAWPPEGAEDCIG